MIRINNISKTKLIEVLSSIDLPDNPKAELEQYFTPPKLATRFLEKIDVKNKIIMDLASGPGVLGFTALVLGAKKIFLVDIDSDAIELSKKNYALLKNKFPEIGECIFINKDVSLLKNSEFEKIDFILINPPFGTIDKNKKIDVVFIKKAMKLSDNILTMHKSSTKDFILDVFEDNNFEVLVQEDFDFPIYKMYSHHKEDFVNIYVTLFIAKKK